MIQQSNDTIKDEAALWHKRSIQNEKVQQMAQQGFNTSAWRY